MENKTYTTKQYLKFIIPSVLGVVLFLIPIKFGGKFTLGVSVLCDIVKAWLLPVVNQLALIFFVTAAVVPVITLIFKPKFILKYKALNNVFNIKPAMIAVRFIGLLYVVSYQFKIGPEWLYSEATGGSAYYIVTEILTLMIVTSFLVSLLMDFGIMDFVGIMVRRLMRPLFTIPGRASLDCMASWLGSSLTGALLTSIQYKEAYYTKREAAVIITCFSTAGFNFIFVMARVCNLEDWFLQSVLVIYAAVIICAIILPRVFPLSRQKDECFEGKASVNTENIPEGKNKMQWALDSAIEKSETMSVAKFMDKGVQTIASVWFDVLPMVMFVATTGMVVAECTPVFQIITTPLVPVLQMMGFAEAELAAPMLFTGFMDQFLPITMANALTSLPTKFFVFCMAIAQIIYMSEIGVIIVRSKMDLPVWKIFLVFLERTVLSAPIIWVLTKILI